MRTCLWEDDEHGVHVWAKVLEDDPGWVRVTVHIRAQWEPVWTAYATAAGPTWWKPWTWYWPKYGAVHRGLRRTVDAAVRRARKEAARLRTAEAAVREAKDALGRVKDMDRILRELERELSGG